MIATIIFGVVLLSAGGGGLFWVNGRSFNRRNVAGIEEFESYGKALGIRAMEKIIRIASWLAIVVGGMTTLAFFLR